MVGGENIPFLFGVPDVNPFEMANGKVVFNDDIFASAFYFLTGWQELSSTKDYLGRFEYEQSIQKRLHIIHVPVVNYYFRLLAKAVELAYGIKLKNKIHAEHTFITWVTHDVDIWANTWRAELKSALKNFNIKSLSKLLLSIINGEYLENNFNIISELQNKYGFKSTYFFLPRQGKHLNTCNSDYNILKPRFRNIIQKLKLAGNEIGMHGGLTTSFDAKEFSSDRLKIGFDVNANRFHYLMFDMVLTPQLLEKNKIRIDSTLGFNSMPGFRNGTSYPFYLYNHETQQATSTLEMPLIIMDVSIFSPNYLGCLNAENGFTKLEPILNQIKKTGGYLTINWHNNYFSENGYLEWRRLFEMIVKYAKDNHCKFNP